MLEFISVIFVGLSLRLLLAAMFYSITKSYLLIQPMPFIAIPCMIGMIYYGHQFDVPTLIGIFILDILWIPVTLNKLSRR
jgi:multidrug efflux pump subunit AcrB